MKKNIKKSKKTVKKVEKNKSEYVTERNNKNKLYIGFELRILISALLFVLCLSTSYYFFTKALRVENSRIINYSETGEIDYKVYLKDNSFYETEYLDEGMNYIASLIDNIEIDMNYDFSINQNVNTNFSYETIGVLSISDSEGNKKLFEKTYILEEPKTQRLENVNNEKYNQNLKIDYDYYNDIANSFKTTYGVNADANLTVYLNIKENVNNESKSISLQQNKSMSIEIPLTKKTLEIMMNENGIDNSDTMITHTKVSTGNLIFALLAAVFFIAMIASLLGFLELLALALPKKSKYDKYVSKILKEYDRLIVETPTEPNFTGKEVIKINKFIELLDVRDNLKRPIMFYNLIKHQKSYFYVESENKIYLQILKSVDFEDKNEKISK